MPKRKRYSREYKLEAIRLMEEGQQTPSEVAAQLGIKRMILYRWQDQLQKHGESAFRGSG